MAQTKIKTTCAKCGNIFEKRLTEFNRAEKKGWKHCCSRSCSAAIIVRNKKGNINFLQSDNRKDEFSSFRWFMVAAKSRKKSRNKEVDISLKDLKDQWEYQNGICPYTGWKLLLPKNSEGWKGERPEKAASLDRINPSKGYIKGNIQFVAVMANWCKNSMEEDAMIHFCKAVANN